MNSTVFTATELILCNMGSVTYLCTVAVCGSTASNFVLCNLFCWSHGSAQPSQPHQDSWWLCNCLGRHSVVSRSMFTIRVLLFWLGDFLRSENKSLRNLSKSSMSCISLAIFQCIVTQIVFACDGLTTSPNLWDFRIREYKSFLQIAQRKQVVWLLW